MQRFIIFSFLEGYAVFLALMQGLQGVRTDEAKYLLNIPYPHPPLVRWILGQTEWMAYQEIFWRIIFASILVQAIWLVMACHTESFDNTVLCHTERSRSATQPKRAQDRLRRSATRMILGCSWLLSAALFMEGGKIIMASLTAVQGLVFVLLLLMTSIGQLFPSPGGAPLSGGRGRHGTRECHARGGGLSHSPPSVSPPSRGECPLTFAPHWEGEHFLVWIGLLWLISLFTAYQAVLFFPIIVAIFWRVRIPLTEKLIYIGGPLILLGLYTLTNPLIVASLINVGGQQVSVPFMERMGGIVNLWLLGGSGAVSVLGMIGMIRAKNIPLIASFILVALYIFIAHRAYYSVLFLPLLIGGMVLLLKEESIPIGRSIGLMAVMLLIFVQDCLSHDTQDLAREVLSRVPQTIGAGDILISGPFGHQWQYRTHEAVRKYKPDLLSDAQAAICLVPCAEIEWRGWKRLMEKPVRVYVPKPPLP